MPEAIDYHVADHICQRLGADSSSILFHSLKLLSYLLRQGHTCLDLAAEAGRAYWQDEEQEGYVFPELSIWQAELKKSIPDEQPFLILEDHRLYFYRHYFFENEIAQRIKALNQQFFAYPIEQIKAILNHLFPQANADDQQRLAVANALGRGFAIIAGGPGTGKTYTVARLLTAIQKLEAEPLRIQLLAPTGKAAQRLTESLQKAKQELQSWVSSELLDQVPDQAATVHRYLGAGPFNHFKYDENHPTTVDLVLVDEASMLDLEISYRLLSALPPKTRLILIGDVHQLPPVEAGHLLNQLCPLPHPGYSEQQQKYLFHLTGAQLPLAQEQAADYLVYLDRSHRFSEKGGIAQLSEAILKGDVNKSWNIMKKAPDIAIHDYDDLEKELKSLVDEYYRPLANCRNIEQAFEQLSRFRILCPTRGHADQQLKTVESINDYIHRLLGQDQKKGLRYYHACPVMVNKNYYHLGLFNGDIGLIWRDEHENYLKVVFPQDQGYQAFNINRIPDLEVVYAMTVHKTQGSEYQHIALILPDYDSRILSKELLYTAVTRAKQYLYIWSSMDIWRASMEQSDHRYSGLKYKLC